MNYLDTERTRWVQSDFYIYPSFIQPKSHKPTNKHKNKGKGKRPIIGSQPTEAILIDIIVKVLTSIYPYKQ